MSERAETHRAARLVVNRFQARAIANLMDDGMQAGSLADPPPVTLAILTTSARREPFNTLDRNADGSHRVVTDEEGREVVQWLTVPGSNEIAVVAEDGRAWTVAREGICWPVPS